MCRPAKADPLIIYDATRSAVELGATGMRLGALHLSGQQAAVASRFARRRRLSGRGLPGYGIRSVTGDDDGVSLAVIRGDRPELGYSCNPIWPELKSLRSETCSSLCAWASL
jgi:hypothetical protein